MQAPVNPTYMTAEQYLESEEHSSIRREYVDGQVFAMSGSTRRHNIISGNMHSILRAHVRGSKCRAYIEAVKARVEEANCFYYPDVMVSCEKYDEKSVYTNCPVLVVEVLSRSTAAIDRREKRANYKKIEALTEFVLVHQRKKCVELYRKDVDGNWEQRTYGAGASVLLESIPVGPLTISVDDLYEDVRFDGADPGIWEVQESEADYDFSADGDEELDWLDW